MPERIELNLRCCNALTSVVLDERDAPVFAPRELRKNILCPSCGSLLIVSQRTENGAKQVDQELIDLA